MAAMAVQRGRERGQKEDVVCPGNRLGRVTEFSSGPGTYVRGQYVFASLVGRKTVITPEDPNQPKVVTVSQPNKTRAQDLVMEVGDTVMGRVTRTSTQETRMEIVCVGEVLLPDGHQGIIRKEDVRSTEKDKVQMAQSFRPGDIVRARVISLGDSRQYYLSTAENELGVRWAKSSAGAIMVPISWQEMQCPVTKLKEPRKCAKPV